MAFFIKGPSMDVGYSILVAPVPGLLVSSCTIIANTNHSCTVQLCPLLHWIIHLDPVSPIM
jgi:hypothetical protein